MLSHTYSHCEWSLMGREGKEESLAFGQEIKSLFLRQAKPCRLCSSCFPSNCLSHHSSLTGFTPTTLDFLVLLKHVKVISTSRPLHLLFAAPGPLSPQIFTWFALWVLSGPSSIVREDFPDLAWFFFLFCSPLYFSLFEMYHLSVRFLVREPHLL